jgi:hypothetical protein
LSSAQTISDSNQNQTWGVWKTPNPQTPGLQFHAKCDKDIDPGNGTPISSWWSYQFRNTYKGTMDFIYLVEAGIADPKVNKMVGGFKYTLKPGEIYDSGGLLWGSCSQHSLPKTGIHMTLKCVVATGQDAPCFKDADGNPYPQAPQSSLQTEPQNTPETFGPAIIKHGQVAAYWMCQNQTGDAEYYVMTDLFLGTYSLTDGVANSATLAGLTEQFEKWLRRHYPKAQAAGAISAQCTFMGTTQAEAYRLKQKNIEQIRGWLKKDISLVVWGSQSANDEQGRESKPELPPPPSPAPTAPPRPSGPSLQTIMKFLQDTIANRGPSNNTHYLSNDRGQTKQIEVIWEITSFNADAGGCHIAYSLTNPNSADSEFDFDLKDVDTIKAMTFEQSWDELAAKTGHSDTHARSDPPDFIVDVILTNSQDFMFHFADWDQANSVAAGLRQAVGLCGGQK